MERGFPHFSQIGEYAMDTLVMWLERRIAVWRDWAKHVIHDHPVLLGVLLGQTAAMLIGLYMFSVIVAQLG